MTQYGFGDEALCGLQKGCMGFAEERQACQRLSRRPRRYGEWMVICASLTSGEDSASPLRGRDAPAPKSGLTLIS